MENNLNKIKTLRKYLGLTQVEFADILEIKQNHLSNIEKGERNITLDIAQKLCNYFDLSLDWLIRDKGEAPTRIHIVKKYESSLKSEKVL